MFPLERYNEAIDADGQPRPAWHAFHARTGLDLVRLARDGHARAPAPLGRFAILPVPLVIDDHEYRQTIAPGIRQRALALQSFFLDLVRGDFAALGNPGPLVNLVTRLLGAAGATGSAWAGKHLEDVRFTYAPDLVRGPDGQWRVLEDNVGCVGGVVDAYLATWRVLAHLRTEVHPAVPAGPDFAPAVAAFLARVNRPATADDAVALLGPEADDEDSEESRKAHVLRELGLRVCAGPQPPGAGARPDASRLGAVVNFDLRGWTPAAELVDTVFGRQDVALMNAPGVGVLGHKALLPFADRIVSFYSGTPPLVPTAPTEPYDAMPGDPSGWVLKRGDGCQGQSVVFLDGLDDDARRRVAARATEWGDGGAVLQRRVLASVLPGCQSDGTAQSLQVELRPLAFVVGAATCIVGEHLSARAFPNANGRSLGNMSRGARYVGVIREPAQPWIPDPADSDRR